MARPLVVTSGAINAQAETGAGNLLGFSVRESAGTPAAASVAFRDGTSATDPLIAVVSLAASSSQSVVLPAVAFSTGIYANRTVGSTEIVLYIE
jgi:hypothetical protein